MGSLYINTSGGLLSSQIQGEQQFPGGVSAGAGSLAGSGTERGLDFVSNTNAFGKYSPVVNRYIKYVQPVAAAYTQEKVGDIVKNKASQ